LRDWHSWNPGIKIHFKGPSRHRREGRTKSTTFFSVGGLREFVEYLDSTKEKLIASPIYVVNEKSEVPVEVALSYNTSYAENLVSYVNNINTHEGGTHVAGFRRALTRTFEIVMPINPVCSRKQKWK